MEEEGENGEREKTWPDKSEIAMRHSSAYLKGGKARSSSREDGGEIELSISPCLPTFASEEKRKGRLTGRVLGSVARSLFPEQIGIIRATKISRKQQPFVSYTPTAP